MSYVKAYVTSLVTLLSCLGLFLFLGYLLQNNTEAEYVLIISLIGASAGPLRVYIDRKENAK